MPRQIQFKERVRFDRTFAVNSGNKTRFVLTTDMHHGIGRSLTFHLS